MPMPPAFSGPVVAMGTYSLDEITEAAPRTVRPTGIELLDRLTGGVGAGEFWAVTGLAGVGVSTLVRRIAAGVARSGAGVLVDGHTPTRLLAGMLDTAGAPRSLQVGSAVVLPEERGEEWCTDLAAADVVLLDTWDEQWLDDWWSRSPDEQVGRARILRDHARLAEKSLVVSVRRLGGRHVLDEVIRDVADVHIDVNWPDRDSPHDRILTVVTRGRGGVSESYVLALSGNGG